MVGGVFPKCLGATGNPTAQDAKHNARNTDENKDKENRLGLIEVKQIAHPGNHLSKELTDLRKQGSNSGSSGLKTSSFHKNIYGHLSRT